MIRRTFKVSDSFIKENNLKLKTSEECRQRLTQIFDSDYKGKRTSILLNHMERKSIDSFCEEFKELCVPKDIQRLTNILTTSQETINLLLRSINDFAMGIDCKNIDMLKEYLWVISRDDLRKLLEIDKKVYEKLFDISDSFGIKIPENIKQNIRQKYID